AGRAAARSPACGRPGGPRARSYECGAGLPGRARPRYAISTTTKPREQTMTIGVGGSTVEAELAKLSSMRGTVPPITDGDRAGRIERAQAMMREAGIAALWLDVSASLTYFTGLRLRRSERLHGAVLPAKGEITYL